MYSLARLATVLIIILIMSGCATFQSRRDDAYNKYVRHEISNWEYRTTLDRINREEQEKRRQMAVTAMMMQQFSQNVAESRRAQEAQQTVWGPPQQVYPPHGVTKTYIVNGELVTVREQ